MSELVQEKPEEIDENKLTVAFAIIPFSIAGVLIRIAIQRLEDYPGAPVFFLVYTQWIGCFIMGIALKNKNDLFYWYQPSHPAITTGLCGSITTFSSWQLGIFKEFANYYGYPHTRGKNILSALSELLVTLAMSLNGISFGQHVGEWICSLRDKKIEPKIKPRGFSTRYLTKKDYGVILFGILSWLGAMFACIFSSSQRDLAFACFFAPVGALTRWCLSFHNSKNPAFPIGTFFANIFGTAVLASLAIIEASPNMNVITCVVIQGLADGYCGCLTTISTFMVELTSLPRKPSYIYGFVSVVIGQIFMFLILGTYIWSQGINQSC